MPVNEGTLDRGIRVVLGATILWLGTVSGVLESPLTTVAVVVGVVLLITGVTGFCGLYRLLGISTCARSEG
ncbi:MAG TPA: DUF2892 domain-containing protein [Longimicrobiales bacterium]|nr:DUF2892 domain-containing protein [Longimicrobiales bacterium]